MEAVEVGDVLVPDAGKEGLEVMAILEQRPYDVMEREFQQARSPPTFLALRITRVQRKLRRQQETCANLSFTRAILTGAGSAQRRQKPRPLPRRIPETAARCAEVTWCVCTGCLRIDCL